MEKHLISPVTIIPVINKEGQEVAVIPINDRLHYVGGRVSRGEKLYYKGLGGVYEWHSSRSREYEVIGKSDIFYYGYKVCNPKWVGKYGIFQERMQPYFSDLIFGCGPKELRIIKNSERFKLSAVIVDNVTKWTDDFGGQYYFTLQYTNDRRKFLDGSCDEEAVQKLIKLLEYMLQEDWCVPWDKGFISDVGVDGKVTDVADMFKSKVRKHKLGTIYALLHSLWKKNKDCFQLVCDQFYYGRAPSTDGLWASVLIICLANRIGNLYFPYRRRPKVYEAETIADYFIRDILITGRNCASVESTRHGTEVAKQYRKRYNNMYGTKRSSIRRYRQGKL